MKGKFIFSLIITTVCSQYAAAQFSDSTHYVAGITANGNFSKTGDGMTSLFNNTVRFGTKFDKFHFNSAATWLYGKNPTKLTNDDWNAIADFNLFSNNPQFYYWGLFNYTSSYSLRVNHQYQTGLGLAYRFFPEQPFNFSISDGILYEFSDINTSDTSRLHYETFRNSLRIRINYKYGDKVKIASVFFHQPSLQYKNDYILSSNTTVQIKIWKWINLSSGFTYNKVSRTNKENMVFTYGLTAERFF
jgi:hypothetical protein